MISLQQNIKFQFQSEQLQSLKSIQKEKHQNNKILSFLLKFGNSMPNSFGLLSGSKSKQYQCQDCQLIFDNAQVLQKHKTKFCLNSKYSNLETLEKEFNEKSKGRDISLYGKPSLINQKQNKNLPQNFNQLAQQSQILGLNTVLKNNSTILDQQYQSVLNQLTNKQSLKKKLQRQKHQAYQELEVLEKRQNEVLIGIKQDQLSQVLKRRKELEDEELKIQEQMNLYEKKRKQMEKQVQMVDKQGYIYKEARYAGKLAKQRQILQEKRKEMEQNLKKKRKERNQIEHQLNSSQFNQKQPHIQPNFRHTQNETKPNPRKVVTASTPNMKTPQDSLDSLSFQNTNRNNNNLYDQLNNPNVSVGPPSVPQQNVGTQHWPSMSNQNSQVMNSYNSPLQRSAAEIFNLPHQKHSNPLTNKDQEGDDMYPYFNPKNFSKNQKLLTDMLNRNGKSEEDLFIEMLNAQQYDSLNLLSKIPKGSDLYQVKLKQYQEISKLRDDYKKQAHQKRVDKMKREFQYEKKIMQKQMQNAQWVDQNRKLMLAQQINIVQNQGMWQKDKQKLYQQASLQLNKQKKPYINQPNILNNQNTIIQNNLNPNQYPSQQNMQKLKPQNLRQTPQQSQFRKGNNLQAHNIQEPSSLNPYENYLNQLQKIHSSQQSKHNKNLPGLRPSLINGVQNSNTLQNGSSNALSMNPINSLPLSNQRLDFNKIKQQSEVDDSKYLWGYKITVQSLKNYIRSKPIKITLIMKEHDISSLSDSLQYEFSTTYHFDKLGTEINSYNPNMSNKRDRNKNVIFKQQFTIPQNLQQIYNNRQSDMYLWIIAYEKDESKLSNEPVIYGWYVFKLIHFGQLKEGKFTVNLYADPSTYPYPSDMNKKKNKLNEEITFELSQILQEKQQPPEPQIITQQSPYNPPQVINLNSRKNQISANGTQYSNQKEKPPSNQQIRKNTQSQIPSQTSITNQMGKKKNSVTRQPYFIPLEMENQFINTNNKTPKNLDITLTQLRTLPSYTGPVKIQLTFLDSEGIEVLPREQILSQIGSGDMYNPLISYVKMIRNQKLMTPTTIVFIRFLALNALDYEIYMLGFTVFYLFFDQNANPCSSNSMKDFMISTGYFQLPIFWGSCKPFYSSIEDLIESYPLIPCSSLLIGCVVNDSNKPSRIPSYGQKIYNTVLFNVQENQTWLFEEQYKREKLDSTKILGAYLKFKGFDTKYTQQQAKSYFFKTMGFTDDNISNLFPLDYMAEYNPFFGVYFAIDKITLPRQKQNYYYFMTICMSPPGEYYTSKKKDSDGLKVIYSVDAQNSLSYEVSYEQSEMIFEPKYNLNSCLIVQFNRIKVGSQNQLSQNIQSYAHVIVPLFKEIDEVRCVNVMKDTVNTYAGPYSFKDIEKTKNDLPTYLDQLVDVAKPSQLEFSFRLMNGFFTTQFSPEKPQTPKQKKTSYLGWYSRPIDFEQTRKKVKLLIERNILITL